MSKMEWEKFPIIDWELGNRLAGNNPDLAKDMLAMLTNGLPDDITTINQLSENQNYSELLKHVHKLHGAVSYCGAPRLKAVLAYIEIRLKSDLIDELPFLMSQLNSEMSYLLDEFSVDVVA